MGKGLPSRPEGKEELKMGLTPEDLVEMYRKMLLIRRFEKATS